MSEFSSFRSDAWRGSVHRAWLAPLAELDSWLTGNPGSRVVDKPARQVRRVETPQGVVFVKIIRLPSEQEQPGKRLLGIIKWYCRPSRALAVFAITKSLLEQGIGCPEPILAARRRSSLGWPEDVFISREVLYPTILQLLSETDDPAGQQTILAHAARGIAQLHTARFIHGDCIPGNICLSPEGKLIFLDNDRTCRTSPFRSHRARFKNLVQLLARLPQGSQREENIDHFLETYRQHAGVDIAMTPAQQAQLARQTQARLAHLAHKRALWEAKHKATGLGK
ncbi:MAG: lipopolysaccharide kinase InaA family protein [Lentisphaeria bacterium]|jgi:tRNA A-37 threonylcarbamoyl transferase component Bud32|nr:lipopolysaccharide kinase InaA family protein [Lentisphaeria bacterium]